MVTALANHIDSSYCISYQHMIRSLVRLADIKELPEFQQMDLDTLNWIRENKPSIVDWNYQKDLFIFPFPQEEGLLDKNWFLEPRVLPGIHGTRHALRVSIYAYALAKQQRLSDANCRAIALAGLLHDVRRTNDKDDPNHGTRCANWLEVNSSSVDLFKNLRDEEKSMVTDAIRQHELDYQMIVLDKSYTKNREAIDILKTADALDRYRLPKKKWWIDEKYLVLKPLETFKAFSFDLVVKSEQRCLEGASQFRAVLEALRHITHPYEP